jgi:TnpA family transposase
MIYWHVERGRLCVYSQLKPCSSSEVAAMIEGLLHRAGLRTAETDQVLRRFTKGGGPKHPVYLALEELGRAVRTIFAS